jgi:hypothetical protein
MVRVSEKLAYVWNAVGDQMWGTGNEARSGFWKTRGKMGLRVRLQELGRKSTGGASGTRRKCDKESIA